VVAPARQRITVKLDQVRSGALNDVLTGRLDGWRAGARMLASHPLLGAGPGAYRAEFAPTKLEMIEEGKTFWWGHTDGSLFVNAHNEPIEVGAELGVLGLIALGWCLWTILGARPRRHADPAEDISEDPSESDRRALAWAGLAALAVLSLAYFPMRTALVAYPFVLLLAWVLEARGGDGAGDHSAAAPEQQSEVAA
jgi:O-antigen ligase